jgi:hypothetical protein
MNIEIYKLRHLKSFTNYEVSGHLCSLWKWNGNMKTNKNMFHILKSYECYNSVQDISVTEINL